MPPPRWVQHGACAASIAEGPLDRAGFGTLRGVHVLAMEVVIRIPAARTLKDRRQVVRSLVEAPRRRFSVASAELDDASECKRAVIGYSVVSGSPGVAEHQMDPVEDFVWSHPDAEVVSAERFWLEH